MYPIVGSKYKVYSRCAGRIKQPLSFIFFAPVSCESMGHQLPEDGPQQGDGASEGQEQGSEHIGEP